MGNQQWMWLQKTHLAFSQTAAREQAAKRSHHTLPTHPSTSQQQARQRRGAHLHVQAEVQLAVPQLAGKGEAVVLTAHCEGEGWGATGGGSSAEGSVD